MSLMKGKLLFGMLVLALLVAPVALAGTVEIGGDFTEGNSKATIPCKAVKGLMHSPRGEHVVLNVFLKKAGLSVETAGCFD